MMFLVTVVERSEGQSEFVVLRCMLMRKEKDEWPDQKDNVGANQDTRCVVGCKPMYESECERCVLDK